MANPFRWRAAVIAFLTTLAPSAALACACGCGVFDVGGGAFMPETPGARFTAFVRYSFMDQDQNWAGDHAAPASDNLDKQILTHFLTVGGQYAINSKWSVSAELPIYDRTYRSTDDGSIAGPAGSIYRAHITAPGDLQVMATYSGLASDGSTGIAVGLKLPTGVWNTPFGPKGGAEFDRDTLPGTGTTDMMVEGYHFGSLDKAQRLNWFVQARFDAPLAARAGYRPGDELDAAAGLTWELGRIGPFDKVAPMLQAVDSWRARDSGPAADRLNSGYERVLISPGIEARIRRTRLSADVELPVYQQVNAAPARAVEGTRGQLVAPILVKVSLAYDF
jgi:hypothetical protein